MNRLRELLYPELRSLNDDERERALRHARDTPFDAIELISMAAVLVIVTALTRYGVAGLEADQRFAAALLNFLVALPLLAVGCAPFLLRRTRRGLRSELGRHVRR